jgi:predicted DNA-binding transcriptional regulator AlpA
MKNEDTLTRESQMKPYLNSVQVGAYLGVTDRTIRNWVGQGVFPPPVKIGGVARWRRVDIDAHMMAAAARALAEARTASACK